MEVADVDTLALIGGGLPIKSVPAAATYAAHELFILDLLPKSLGNFTSNRFVLGPTAHVYGVFGEYERSGLLQSCPLEGSRNVLIRAHFTIVVSI